MSKRVRIIAAAVLVAAVATAIALVAGSIKTSSLARDKAEGQAVAAQRHQDRFGIAGREGPLTYADQVAALNAYPAATISAVQIAGAQAAFTKNEKHGTGNDKKATSSWLSLGPTSSVYPASLNRHGSDYPASGRITALAMAPDCNKLHCTVWVGAAGGGVWRTENGLSTSQNWRNVSDGSFTTGAVGSLTYDAKHNALYAGTGELAAAGDAEAGRGIWKSTDRGNTWTALGGNANFDNRAIRQIAVDQYDPTGNTIYVADGRGVHGISSTTAGVVSAVPGAPPWGVYKSTDGGATFTLLSPAPNGLPAPHPPTSSFGGPRGVTDVAVDPTHAGVIYATSYGQGVWRSIDNGVTWTNIHPCAITCSNADRSEFALATLPRGDTRMYLTEGDSGGAGFESRFWVGNAVQGSAPSFVLKTNSSTDSPGYATFDFCTGQCWYDQGVYSPPGQPRMVYVFGSFVYGEAPDLGQDGYHTAGTVSNGRAVLLSTDGGETFTDLTEDATSATHPQGLHPDQHALVTVPSNPLQFFEGSDGGLMLSDGTLKNISSRCDGRGLSIQDLKRCKQLLSAVPGSYTSLNTGLQTLQFQSLSVNPNDSKDIQGGTQDNGTFETHGSQSWPQTIFGDGGLSGFDATNTHFRVHTYFGSSPEVSFRDGIPSSWNYTGDPLNEPSLFYFPVITDPVVSGTMYSGLTHVWRTLDDGGPQAYLEEHCNEFTGDAIDVTPEPDVDRGCGDWVPLGGPDLTSAASATDTKVGGNVELGRADTVRHEHALGVDDDRPRLRFA